MRSLLYVLTALGVMGLAFWAYRENYSTQAEIERIAALQGDIGELRESLSVLKAEWAYLNRPDRLRELADMNFDRLGLAPLDPEQFAAVAQITYPRAPQSQPGPALSAITDPIETMGTLPAKETNP